MNKILNLVSYLLVVVGALNWGLVGFLDFNLVNFLLGNHPRLEVLVYDIVGLAAIVSIIIAMKHCRENKNY